MPQQCASKTVTGMDQQDAHPPLVSFAERTNIGLRRLSNQDAYACVLAHQPDVWEHRGHLFLVADGMGAHAAGELASKIAAEDIPLAYQKVQPGISAPVALKQAIEDANETIHRKGSRNFDFQGMGTTCTALALYPGGALLGHVGDSRAYRLRGNKLEQLTRDHSLVWELKEHGQIDVGPGIPRNIITRSLGPNPDVEVDIEGPFEVLPGDRFLLCSDGLSGQLSDHWIAVILRLFSLEEAAQLFVHLANLHGGGPDNITVVAIEVPFALGGAGAVQESDLGEEKPAQGWLVPLAGLLLGAGCGGLVAWGKPLPLPEGLVATVGGAVIGLALGLAAKGWFFSAKDKPRRKRRKPLLHGHGPYTEASAQADEDLVEQLHKILKDLCHAAAEDRWEVCWKEVEQLQEQALQAVSHKNWNDAVVFLGKAVLRVMSKARKTQAGVD